MSTQPETKKLWTCPECGRSFERQGQQHSCRPFALERHFERKPYGKQLYDRLVSRMKKDISPLKIESLECCIHFVSTFTFAAVKILRNKIRLDFALTRQLQHPRIARPLKMSVHRYLCVVDISREEEIDDELMGWIREAHLIKMHHEEEVQHEK